MSQGVGDVGHSVGGRLVDEDAAVARWRWPAQLPVHRALGRRRWRRNAAVVVVNAVDDADAASASAAAASTAAAAAAATADSLAPFNDADAT